MEEGRGEEKERGARDCRKRRKEKHSYMVEELLPFMLLLKFFQLQFGSIQGIVDCCVLLTKHVTVCTRVAQN